MAEANNFYEWLGLSVEYFEEDISKIEPIYNDCIKRWNSSKNINIQQRAAIYKEQIKQAYTDSNEWKRFYEEYRKKVNNDIGSNLEFVAEDRIVAEDKILTIAGNFKVSSDYVKKIAENRGYEIGEDSGKSDIPKPTYTIESIKPSFSGKLEPLHKIFMSFGFKDVSELISDQQGINLELDGPSADKSKIIEALEEIKKKWVKVSANGPKAQAKSNYEKVCTGMIGFFKTYSLEDYNAYLQYKRVKDILDEVFSNVNKLGVDSLKDSVFDGTVKRIYEIIGIRDNAKSILEAFCRDKDIGYSRPVAKVAICPFCANRFEKSEPIQTECPVCRTPLVVKCPKCNSDKNLLVDSSCDGIDLHKFPIYLTMLQKANKAYDRLRLDIVRNNVEEITNIWENFPGVDLLLKKCSQAEKNYGDKLRKIIVCKNNGQYFSAKKLCDDLSGDFPECKDTYRDVYDTVEVAKRNFDAYKKETNLNNKLNMLMQLVEEVSDYSEANIELEKYPIDQITNFNTAINSENGKVNISWKSANKPGSVMYHVVRKKGSKPVNENDGTEIIVTSGTSYVDETLEEGTAYYYAVYAKRGNKNSALVSSIKPMIFLKSVAITVIGKEGAIDVSWPLVTCGQVKLAIATSPIKSIENGSICSGITNSGCCIKELNNGVSYYLAVCKEINLDGVLYRSEVTTATAQPMMPIEPPNVLKELGTNAGTFIFTHENKKSGDMIQFYCSDKPVGIKEKSDINLVDLTAKAKVAVVTSLGNGKYSMNMDGKKELCVYPAIVRGSTVTIGNILTLKFVKTVSVVDHIVAAGKLVLRINEWPEGAGGLYVCYNDDVFPADVTDCDKKLPVITKGQFDAEKSITIPGLKNQQYYISIFARIETDYLPVCNFHFNMVSDTLLQYEFSTGLFDTKVKLYCDTGRTPELEVRVKKGSAPLRNSDGECIYVIPDNPSAPAVQEISIGSRAEKGVFYKLFTKEKGYMLMPKGNLCLRK